MYGDFDASNAGIGSSDMPPQWLGDVLDAGGGRVGPGHEADDEGLDIPCSPSCTLLRILVIIPSQISRLC